MRLLEAGDFLIVDCPDALRAARRPLPGRRRRGLAGQRAALRRALARRGAARRAARSPLEWRPEVVHCNDWPTGARAGLPAFASRARAARVMTIHNLAFQGIFDASLARAPRAAAGELRHRGPRVLRPALVPEGRPGLRRRHHHGEPDLRARDPDRGARLRAGRAAARARATCCAASLNGIDTELWNPMTRSRASPQRYALDSLERKAANKARAAAAAEPRGATPTCRSSARCAASRTRRASTSSPRAADELVDAAGAARRPRHGRARARDALAALAARHPGPLAVADRLRRGRSRTCIEAGADLFLMPSRFEPCGLNQMYSQRYGTPPVARATGGLADTVADGETGFLSSARRARRCSQAVRRGARGLPRRAALARDCSAAAMARDFSWSGPARQYADLYAEARQGAGAEPSASASSSLRPASARLILAADRPARDSTG